MWECIQCGNRCYRRHDVYWRLGMRPSYAYAWGAMRPTELRPIICMHCAMNEYAEIMHEIGVWRAERVGFEPTAGTPATVFGTVPFSRSGTSPR